MHTSLLPLSRSGKGFACSRALAVCLLTAALLAAAAGTAPSGRAANANTLTVTNTNDSGAGSLRQAIADAAPGDTINFSLPSGSVIVLTSGELVIDKSLNITGPGAAALAVSSRGQFRVLRVTSSVAVNISGLTIRDGFASPVTDPTNAGGGGVHNSGTLTLAACVVSGSTTVGGVVISSDLAFSGGGINNLGTLMLRGTTVSGNTARGAVTLPDFRSDGYGGGIHNNAGATLAVTEGSIVTGNTATGGAAGSTDTEGQAGGGGISNFGTLNMANSTVSNNRAIGKDSVNSATRGGEGAGGGVQNYGGTMNADFCSFVNNTAQSGSAPINTGSTNGAYGGGVDNLLFGTVTMTGCTVSDNFAIGGNANAAGRPGGGNGGGINNSTPRFSSNISTVTVTNSTISSNVARGGNVANPDTAGTAEAGAGSGGGVASGGLLTMTNSTVSGNEAQGGTASNQGDSFAGQAQGSGVYAALVLRLTNCTVTRNAAVGGHLPGSSSGGGVYSEFVFRGPNNYAALNTIIAGNSFRVISAGGADNFTDSSDLSGFFFRSLGHNLIGNNEGVESEFPAGMPNAMGDIVGTSASPVDAKLGPLAYNGGVPRTHRPWPGSPAIESGDNAVLSPPYNLTTDQRGSGFPRLVNSFVDIGAVEYQGSSSTFAFTDAAPSVNEGAGRFDVTVTRAGGLDAGDTTVDFSATDGSTASSRSDFDAVFGTLRFASGETSKTFTVFITDDAYAEEPEGVRLTLSNPTGGASLAAPATATITVDDNDSPPPPTNPIDDSQFFVRQHYVDFLGRDPDSLGLAFWVNEIEKCGADGQCRDARRINVSAAFFLSIEFRETGFFALRVHRAAFGNRSAASSRVTLLNFLRDARQLGEGVVVGAADWEQRLEQNKLDYLARMVETPAFRQLYPDTLNATGFADALFTSAGVTPTAAERTAAINSYAWGGTAGRAAALRSIAESASVTNAEVNPAFVLSEYFGYLRRNPTDAPDTNDSGYNFWLAKLNQFNGDFVRAEMVKAFLSSAEYRRRFGNN